MSDETNQTDPRDTPIQADPPPRYQHDDATRIVPMQFDKHGNPFWESFMTPSSYEVRAEAQIPPHLPGIIIFVHGVNSEGEWYDVAEKALCDGLNQRLNREDLSPNSYSDVDEKTNKKGPRQLIKIGYSPIIRFYWGYRAKDGDEKKYRVVMRNDNDTNFWAQKGAEEAGPWYWGGGPFQNGTNNLQQLWSEEGIKRHIAGFDLQHLNPEVDRQLEDAPPRTYYAHAAQRLADLVDKIRKESPRDTVTLFSHSQGTMIALAATALCKTRAPDSVVVMDSPFALEDKFTDALSCGAQRPTEAARIKTFKNIAERIKADKKIFTEEKIQMLQCGATEDMNFWRPDLKNHFGCPERDNHGRLYVYFNPHDRVMGASPLQSIGWQGVSTKVLDEIGDTVKQRMLARGTSCGDYPSLQKFGTLPPIPDPAPNVAPTDFWNGNKNTAFKMKLWAVPPRDQMVRINAEKVPNPITAEEMSKPIKTETGIKYFDEAPQTAVTWGATKSDGTYAEPSFPKYASIYDRSTYMVRDDVYAPGGKRRELETDEELQERIKDYTPMPTNHSTLPQHVEFLQRVAAYDLPIGFCDSYQSVSFWRELRNDADWTSWHDPYFTTGQLSVPDMPAMIDKETVSQKISEQQIADMKLDKGA
ncbi:Putative transmembrane protein [Collimonas arenae]|uniref:Putative transmembrane protein n=1 Tax=Collimonas arenae TaxID=279058 RepID=A0A0A1FHC7_9BURK|nr:hypothetical protein [Collimonas arenae]AIY43090.1 Putative transmembrane protein [Collimonas arenae]